MPCGLWFSKAYQDYVETLADYMSLELKKRGATRLKIDVSYKACTCTHALTFVCVSRLLELKQDFTLPCSRNRCPSIWPSITGSNFFKQSSPA